MNSTDVSKSSFPMRRSSQAKVGLSDQNKSTFKHQRVPLKNRTYEVLRFMTKMKFQNAAGQQTNRIKYKNVSVPMPEVLSIANGIGYDLENDDGQYFWFLKRILTQELPMGWVKDTSLMGEAFYHNEQLNVTTIKHPYLNFYRKLFNKIVNNRRKFKFQIQDDLEINKKKTDQTAPNKSKKATFIVKNQDETQIQKDDLEIIQQRVYGEKDIQDFKTMMADLGSESEKKYKKIGEIQSLGRALNFYEKLVGFEIKNPPSFLKNHPQFLQITPEDLVKMGAQYKLDLRTETDLLWIPRMINCLPLPPFWKKCQNDKVNESFELLEEKFNIYYKDLENNSQFNFHPCTLFIIKLINKRRIDKINQGVGIGLFPQARSTQLGKNQNQQRRASGRHNVSLANLEIKFMDNLCRVYKCTGKELFEYASESLNLENKGLDEIFQYDQEKLQREMETYAQVFQTQVSLQIHEKQLTDFEIQALAQQCKLSIQRDTYLYKSLYEFIAQKYQEQEEAQIQYDKNLAQAKDKILVVLPEPPKVWIFRHTIQGPYYWIEKHTKEISTVYPFLRDLRRLIEEIKVTNTAAEQFVVTNNQIKALKKVQNYIKLKQYSSCFIEKLIQQQLPPDENEMETSESEDEDSKIRKLVQDKGFLDNVMRDLDIEEQMSKEQLLQWMFSWPYELSDQFFAKREEIQKKIEEDLRLIREKSLIRKQTMDRMVRKINVLNRISKAFGSKLSQNNIPILNEQQKIKVQEEEILQRIKKTKAVIGVSDLRIRKKLRFLITKAIQDEDTREKLQELEMIEKELLESHQKKKQEQLKQQLKEQLGLDVSDMEEEEMEIESNIDSTIDDRKISQEYGNDSEDDTPQQIDEENGEDQEYEPEDDSFTYKPGQQNTNDQEMQPIHEDPEYPNDEEDINLIDADLNINQEELDQHLSPVSLEPEPDQISLNETVEARRKRLENQMIQNKLKEISESKFFIQRYRRIIMQQQNISKTQDNLKKKIIKLKMMQLRIHSDDKSSHGGGSDDPNRNSMHDGELDFISEILRIQEAENSSSEESLGHESTVSFVSRISEANSRLEDSKFEERIQKLDEEIKDEIKIQLSMQVDRNIGAKRFSENNFYDDFEEIREIEVMLLQRQKTEQSIPQIQLSSERERNSILLSSKDASELKSIREISFKRQSTIQQERRSSSRLSSKKKQGMASPQNYRADSKIDSPQTEKNKNSSLALQNDDQNQKFNNSLLQKSKHGSLRDLNAQRKSISQFSLDSDNETIERAASGIDNPIKLRKNFFVSQLERVDEELDSRNESRLDIHNFGGQSPTKINDGRWKNMMDIQEKRKYSSSEHMSQIRELQRISQLDQNFGIKQQLTLKSNKNDENQLESLPEDVEFQNFLNKIKVFDDEEDDDVNISTLDGLSRFILDFYTKTVGEITHTKEQLKLCTKFTQSLNIDSILFTAQKLRIKVLAQRETDLLWIAQEYLVHPNPNQADYKGDKPAENPLERIKNYYFQQLVKEQRKKRVESIQREVNGSEELDKFMRDNSWLTIYEKNEFYKYNFQTKERELLNLNQNQQNSESQANPPQFAGQLTGGLLSFLKKRGILTTPSTMSNQTVQSAPSIQNQPQQQQQVQSPQLITQVRILDKPKQDHESEALKQFSEQLQAKHLLKMNAQSESDQSSVKQEIPQTTTKPQPSLLQRLMMREPSRPISRFSSEDQTKQLQASQLTNNFSENNLKPLARDNTQRSLAGEIIESQESDLNYPGSDLKSNLDPIFAQNVQSNNQQNYYSGNQQKSNIIISDQIFKTFDSNSSKQNQNQNDIDGIKIQSNSKIPKFSFKDKGRRSMMNIQPNLEAQQIKPQTQQLQQRKMLQSQAESQNDRNSQMKMLGLPQLNERSQKSLSIRPATTTTQQSEEIIRPIRNIKRVIIGNHQESLARRQMQQLENARSLQDILQSATLHDNTSLGCKYLDRHLATSHNFLSPSDEMSLTLHSSSNFNMKTFQKMQENIKLKSMSYLTQVSYQKQLDRIKEETEYEREEYDKKIQLALNITTSIPFNYKNLLREKSETRQNFMQLTAEKGIFASQSSYCSANYNTSRAISQQNTRSVQNKLGGSQSVRELINGNNFRNMSPKSLKRWAKMSELNFDLSKKIGLLKKSHGTITYGKLRRNQEDKMVFSQL